MAAGIAKLNWADFKSFVIAKGIPFQWTLVKKVYWVTATDGPYSYQCIIRIEDPAQDEEQLDFEANYKDLPVKLVKPRDAVTGREIVSSSAFAVNSDYEVKATGFKGVAAAGVSTNIEHAIGVEDRYINGLELLCQGSVMDDTVDFMVVDTANLLGYGVGTVLKQFGFTWNVAPDRISQEQIVFNYLARLPAGFYVRLRYNSTGGASVKVACNLLIHKKVAV